MARVSSAHLAARRQQILDGAAACFARNGFHATSMQDVLAETGLSAGAVYRYFSGKDEMIAAIATGVLETVGDRFAELSRAAEPGPPDQLLAQVLTTLRGVTARRGVVPALVLQVWAEAVRNPRLGAVLREGMGRVVDAWAVIVERYQDAGRMTREVPAPVVARTLVAAVQGFFVQQALLAESDHAPLCDGLRALTTMDARVPDSPDRS